MFHSPHPFFYFFFFNDTAPPEIYTLSLHDALPILWIRSITDAAGRPLGFVQMEPDSTRSEEHTSELQSLTNLVCRLLLEKKKKNNKKTHHMNIIQKIKQNIERNRIVTHDKDNRTSY